MVAELLFLTATLWSLNVFTPAFFKKQVRQSWGRLVHNLWGCACDPRKHVFLCHIIIKGRRGFTLIVSVSAGSIKDINTVTQKINTFFSPFAAALSANLSPEF